MQLNLCLNEINDRSELVIQLLVAIKHPEFTGCFHPDGDMHYVFQWIFLSANLRAVLKLIEQNLLG